MYSKKVVMNFAIIRGSRSVCQSKKNGKKKLGLKAKSMGFNKGFNRGFNKGFNRGFNKLLPDLLNSSVPDCR